MKKVLKTGKYLQHLVSFYLGYRKTKLTGKKKNLQTRQLREGPGKGKNRGGGGVRSLGETGGGGES